MGEKETGVVSGREGGSTPSESERKRVGTELYVEERKAGIEQSGDPHEVAQYEGDGGQQSNPLGSDVAGGGRGVVRQFQATGGDRSAIHSHPTAADIAAVQHFTSPVTNIASPSKDERSMGRPIRADYTRKPLRVGEGIPDFTDVRQHYLFP